MFGLRQLTGRRAAVTIGRRYALLGGPMCKASSPLSGLLLLTVVATGSALAQNAPAPQTVPVPAAAAPAGGQQNCDMSGEWSARSREDWEDRTLLGTNPGDYTGFPLTDAGRQFADLWSASILSLPTQQ